MGEPTRSVSIVSKTSWAWAQPAAVVMW